MKPRSINTQLLLVILGVTVLCWIVVATVVVAYLSLNRASTWDEKLEAIATQLLVTIPASSRFERKAGPGLTLPAPAQRAHDPLVFQIWIARARLVANTPGAPRLPLQPSFVEGAASTVVEGKKWRVYSVSDRDGRVTVQVGNLQSVVDADLRHTAWHALGLATVLLLLAGVIMWFVVRGSLQPVRALGAAMLKRRSFDLAPLPLARLPSELHPLVTSFNHVLKQLDDAIEGERRFIGDAAHELRTPLSALQAQVEIALRADDPRTTREALEKLLLMARRSTRLSEQLLDLARLNAGAKALKQVETDLSRLVEHVAREFEVCAAQNRRAIYLNLRACPIRCDIDEIGILLRNLIDNALRYTGADGKVLVSCGHLAAAEPGAAPQPYLEVADDGPGVPVSERAAIFVRFHRVAGNPMRGSGIGLSLVAGIADLHQAVIETDDGLDGAGLKVRVLFPAVAGAA
ncbi:signal transduction histidine kinase [Duganella sp. 1411]|jgi:signal transduction histidine kinase|uniref:sensor histidine kinase n=1 Tax=Duganella sp. 1411 TaxID=2806572 RepID=UPI001AE9C572|nr:ATP-binding protein [Duganella sp. 1411]MBP1204221.1 signal transduction histidine kinase [Duganella sp. 1411]